jgi:nitrogen regulatory protein P-II 1
VKRIDCVIRPQNLDDVKDRLAGVGVQGITVTEVRGFGRQKGHSEVYRGSEYSVDLLPKLLITIIASDDRVPDILNAVVEGARTGKFGDGKITVTPLDEVIRIRTGERGQNAI